MPNKSKRKKTENKGRWTIFLIYGLVGIVYCLFIDNPNPIKEGPSYYMHSVLLLIALYVAELIQIIFHEAGHLIFGLLTGYRFSSFRIVNLMWVKLDGRVQFRRLNFTGIGGQCLMIPPDLKDGKMPVMLSNLGGAIVNLVTAIICVGLSFLCPAHSPFWMILMILAVMGLLNALLNGLPIQTSRVRNDGKNAQDLFHNEEAIRALWIHLKVCEQELKGIRIKDMPDEWFTVPSDESMENQFIALIGAYAYSRLMDQRRFDEADALIEHLLSLQNVFSDDSRGLLVCERMYVEMISKNRKEILDEMRTEDQLKIMKAMKKSLTVLRTEYVYALLVEGDLEKAKEIKAKFYQRAKFNPYSGEIESEVELIKLAEERMASQQK